MKRNVNFKLFLSLFLIIQITILNPCTSFAGGNVTLDELYERLVQLEKKVQQNEREVEKYKAIIRQKEKEIEFHKKQIKTHKKTSRLPHIHMPKFKKIRAREKKETQYEHIETPGLIDISVHGTGIVQGSPNTNRIYETDKRKLEGSYQADIGMASKLEPINGMFELNLRVGQGSGLNDCLTLYSNVDNNAWGDDHFTLSEFFYEQHLFNDRVIINAGKLDPTVFFDKNEYANSDTTQFLGKIFNNSPVIEFPANSGGIRIAYMPVEWLELGYLIMAGHQDWSKLGSDLFNVARVAVKTEIGGRKGNYRFLFWHNSNPHTEWDNLGEVKENGYGYSFSFDQEITDHLGIFAKFGWQDPSVFNPLIRATPISNNDTMLQLNNFSLEYMWSTGFQLQGRLWAREHDTFGFGIGEVIPSDDMKQYGRKARNEGHVEFYYNFFVNEHLLLTPGIQFIWNPYGGDSEADDVISVYTLRTHIDF